ncbi:hypothetical protein HDIA_2925 [Hartmannibacter diazotrophicus]|uniref:Uncharacterized protein n=1 Tax=Hartmannibacter diazotrophicus TaxID=1482074 RepID=A0A2C9D867_9HYPH|nr:hypothetical protein [Hartmannibacter diazotrophicus]SON56466.1 hypothetical protein HDIA_2925 [Hartmannibacter diazotrophicus]
MSIDNLGNRKPSLRLDRRIGPTNGTGAAGIGASGMGNRNSRPALMATAAIARVIGRWSLQQTIAPLHPPRGKEDGDSTSSADLSTGSTGTGRDKWTTAFKALRAYKDFINPQTWNAILRLSAQNADNTELKYRLADRIAELAASAQSRRDYAEQDRAMHAETHVFSVRAGILLGAIGEELVAATINRLFAGGEADEQDSTPPDQANGMIRDAVLKMPDLILFCPAARLSQSHRDYLIFASRLRHFGCGDQETVARALSSLVYDDGQAAVRLPHADNRYGDLLSSAFQSGFRTCFWSVRQAVEQLDQIRLGDPLAAALFSAPDLLPVMRTFEDSSCLQAMDLART